MQCTSTILCASDTPGVPFSGGWMILWDTLRVACVLGAVAIAGSTPAVAWRAVDRYQRRRFIGAALFAIVVCITEVEHLGDMPSIRLVLNLLAVGFMVAGYLGFWRSRRVEFARRRAERRAP